MNTLLNLVLRWLAGITAEQYKFALDYVLIAAAKQLEGSAKRTWVLDHLNGEGIKGWAANLLVEVAHAAAKKKGLL